MTAARFRSFALAALALTLGVILWGAYVRATGSGAGCGAHWPMCNGVVVPRAPSVATLIELTHRLTSGVALLVVVVGYVWARRAYDKGHPARTGALLSLVFMVSEALVGAGLVLFELVAHDASLKRAFSVSIHLANTFLLLGSMTLTIFWARGGARLRLRGQGAIGAGLFVAVFGAMLVGVSGAIAALGDTLFPVKSFAEGLAQDLSPTAHVFVKLRALHPMIAALVAGLLLFGSGLVATHRPTTGVKRASRALVALVLVQVGAGLGNLALLAPVWMQLIHLLLADAVWITLVWLSAEALEEGPAAGQG